MKKEFHFSQWYQGTIVGSFCFVIGIVTFDAVGISMLMPFIKPELHLKNVQIGWLDSVYLTACALSAFAVSFIAEARARRKRFLVITVVAFSLCSTLPAFATSFWELLAIRFLTGLAAGPTIPLSQSIVYLESSAENRGIRMGIVQNLGGPLLGLFVAPLVLVPIAAASGWRVGFFVVLIPGLVCALLIGRIVREPSLAAAVDLEGAAESQVARSRFAEVLRFRNVYLCAALLCFYQAFVNVGFAFYPLILVGIRHVSLQSMSFLMALLGLSAALFGVLLPAISDRIGRKPLLVGASTLAILFPCATMGFSGSVSGLAALLFVTWAFSGSSSIFSSTIPSETVPTRSISTAIGLILALGLMGGGLAGPAIAGWSADRWGLHAPLVLQIVCAASAAVAAMALRETAPGKLKSATRHLAASQ